MDGLVCLRSLSIEGQMTKKAFYEKAKALANEFGEVVIYFKQPSTLLGNEIEYMRRRKIRANGNCFVSYLDKNNKWTKYHTCCFITEVRRRTIDDSIARLCRHDKSTIRPLMLEYGKSKSKRRIEL